MGLALVLTYVALNLLSPGDLMPSLYPYHPMVFLGLLNLPSALLARMRAPEVGKLRVQLTMVLLFFGYACLAWLPHKYIMGNLNTFLNLSPNVIAYFLGIVHLRTPSRLRLVRAVLVAVAGFILIGALLDWPAARGTSASTPYVMVHNDRSPDGLTVVQSDLRIRGLGMLNDPNYFGQFLLLIIPLLFVAKQDSGLGIGLVFALGITVVLLIGIYFTGSRGAFLGLVVMIGLFLIRRFKTIGALLASIFGSVILLVFQGYRGRSVSMSSGMDRLAIWSDGMQYFKSNFLFGIGPNAFMDLNGMTAHNTFLLVAAEMGIIGLFLWMSMIVVTWVQLSRIPKVLGASNPALTRWAVAMRVSLGGYVFTSFFLSRAYELPLYLLLGMSGGIIVAAGGDQAVSLRGSKWPLWTGVLCVGILLLIYAMLRMRAV